MLQSILCVVAGAIFGFGLCAILTISKDDANEISCINCKHCTCNSDFECICNINDLVMYEPETTFCEKFKGW